MNDKDSEIFKTEMGDVQPFKKVSKVALKNKRENTPGIQARRLAAQASHEGIKAPFSTENIEALVPQAILSFQRPGIQNGVFRKLRLGQYQIEARLDLHRLTVEQALQAILVFIKDSIAYDIRCALITHGKGDGRPEPAKLKSCVAAWLPQMEDVLAFHSAQKHHGGVGATYVLLKKSEKKKQETWERHIGRRR